jgi:hypothetical protein
LRKGNEHTSDHSNMIADFENAFYQHVGHKAVEAFQACEVLRSRV